MIILPIGMNFILLKKENDLCCYLLAVGER